MADSAARLLQLLTLLQRRRHWPGRDLADRLEVSERTLRRDVERLRGLGYEVRSARGTDGGYALGEANAGRVPLLLDDDETVALAASLHLAAHGSTELAEASLGALMKVLGQLPPAQRRRADDIVESTAAGVAGPSTSPSVGVLGSVAQACRDVVRLSFAYRAADGNQSNRYVEPCRLVSLYGRWYLVAWDTDRHDWRTFRVDRMTDPRPARTPFDARPAPADDLRAYVAEQIRAIPGRHRVVLDVGAEAADVNARYGRWAEVTALGRGRCRVVAEVDTLTWAIVMAVELDVDVAVVEPPELADALARAAARFARRDGR